MATAAQIVEDIVSQKPFLQEALSRGILNNAALAEQLMPEIEKQLKKPVKFSAVNMAIRRLAEKLEKTFAAAAKFDKDSDITIKSDLIEITIYKLEDVQKYVQEIYALVDLRKGDFLTLTQGLHEVMIITNRKYEDKILKVLPKRLVKKVVKQLSSISISIPEQAIKTVGLFYIATRALNWENINIIDVVSTYTELTFIINEEDTSRAFVALKKLIEENS
jgi:aspartokinase